MHSERSGTPHSHQEVCITPQGTRMILTGMAQGSQPMVSKPVGVRTAWCVGVDTQADPEDATWQAAFEVTRLHCYCHGQ